MRNPDIDPFEVEHVIIIYWAVLSMALLVPSYHRTYHTTTHSQAVNPRLLAATTVLAGR
jgi:hypothetical protein